MLVVFNILFELLTNVYRNGDTLLGENDLDIQQQPVVNNNKQLVLVAHIQLVLVAHTQLVGQERIPLLVRVEPQQVVDKPRLVVVD